LWGIEQKQKHFRVIICNNKGKKVKVFACNYMRDGQLIAGACSDGSI
jgi:hypothetical protein